MPRSLATPTIINNQQYELEMNLKDPNMKLKDFNVPSCTQGTPTLVELLML
jgi:hypothetical protein